MYLKLGDIVYLKSGGPAMTVNRAGDREGRPIRCHWFHEGKVDMECFPEECLTATLKPKAL